jgi:N-acetylmuramoyl-L-alanine amidase
VADLQRRLRAAGFEAGEHAGEFCERTEQAVTDFQRAAGLRVDGVCDAATWSALVESGYELGDRLLCLRSPMMRGDDVSELQLRLSKLGFDTGRVDGIFGPATQAAVGDFQRNAGLVGDEVCGPETTAALRRLEGRAGTATVTGVRERDQLRRRATDPSHLRVALGSSGELHTIVTTFAAELRRGGTSTLLLDSGWSEQAAASNEFNADVYLGVVVADEPLAEAAFFAAPGYESYGGRRLAERIIGELPAAPGWGIGSVQGLRIPILRETRPPAVLLTLGSGDVVDQHTSLVVAALHRALSGWSRDPS